MKKGTDPTRRRLLALAAAAVLASPPLQAAPLVSGDAAPMLTLEDQHGKPVAVPGAARWLLFAPDKAAADLAQAWLTPQGAEVLRKRQLVYLADISAMPAVVTRMFALPKLRELPFAIGLLRESGVAAAFPRQPRALTLMRLEQGRIAEVRHVSDEAGLRDALDALP